MGVAVLVAVACGVAVAAGVALGKNLTTTGVEQLMVNTRMANRKKIRLRIEALYWMIKDVSILVFASHDHS